MENFPINTEEMDSCAVQKFKLVTVNETYKYLKKNNNYSITSRSNTFFFNVKII